jgi:predicted DNA-binding transcriptional regulator AlpA
VSAPPRTRSDLHVESALAAFFDLTRAEQFRFYATVAEYLGAGETQETEQQRRTRERSQALADMKRAADHHGLAADEAPKARDYDSARRDLGLSTPRTKIIELFEFWDTAKAAYLGTERHETRGQRSLRSRAQVSRQSHLDLVAQKLEGLELWLNSTPPPPDTTAATYDDFARRHNASGETPHLTQSQAIREVLGVYFEHAVAVARREMTLEAARALRQQDLDRNAGAALMLREHVAEMLDLTGRQLQHRLRRGEFTPTPIRFSRSRQAWLREDVEAYRAGRPVPERDSRALRWEFLTREEVAGMLHRNPRTLSQHIRAGRWHLVPAPEARFASFSYWRRSDVLAWREQHSR